MDNNNQQQKQIAECFRALTSILGSIFGLKKMIEDYSKVLKEDNPCASEREALEVSIKLAEDEIKRSRGALKEIVAEYKRVESGLVIPKIVRPH